MSELVKFQRSPGGKPKRCRLIDALGQTVEFETLTDAAQYVVGADGNYRAAVSGICRAIAMNKTAYGFRWEEVNEDHP